ncbi:MAG TPA: ATP-binding protein [Terriglobales bacterium]|jgi:signal transduction histidine kinase|nr:ATP-binding protein [Terriglobales bacterium]
MSFRRKLLAVFALTVCLSVAAVTWIVSATTRRAFERSDEERTLSLIAQFRREFNRRGDEVVRRVATIAASDATTRMALALSRGVPDYGAYLSEAKNIADNQQLDFLEFVDNQGTIISSAQWPAKFGYRETSLPAQPTPKEAFLRREDLPDAAGLSLSAIRQVNVGDKPLYVIGGRRIDKDFLNTLELPTGMRAMFYQNFSPGFSPQFLIDPSGTVQQPDRIAPLVERVQQQRQDATELIHWSSGAVDDETVHAIPLPGQDGQLLGILLVGNSRRPYVELRQRIRSAALLVGGGGILLAILLSGWVAARVTRPVEQLAAAAREVAAGNWNTRVEVSTSDELGELAESFNRMTGELLDQKERLVQAERVAAWRELARRLAHELKNPLFPLQLTVENLIRARQQTPEQFEEVLRESSSTLLAEISNLKAIISRFSEFSKMPQPQFRRVQLNDVVANVARLFQAQLHAPDRAAIDCQLQLAEPMDSVVADPELLHRAISNLVLNAMDAMPQGGTLRLRTHQQDDRAFLEVSDTGSGLTPEECERLFTPYYTSKPHGTGLGLAIVQSVVSDHGGRINVQSQAGRGTTFVIELPKRQQLAVSN